jgi:uncharacterized membrane protein YdbT with pleckstrin-like domain
MTVRTRLLRWLRVPHEPDAPPGDADVRIFRAAPSYFRYRLIIWALRQLGGIAAIVAVIVFAPVWIPDFGPNRVRIGPVAITRAMAVTLFDIIELAGLGIYVVQAIGSGLILRLDYEQRWYLLSNRSLRIREGLVRLQERTMTFANIQHVGIRQNPIQRWLGIADVEVRTAGGGAADKDEHSGGADLHIAYLRGVVDAPAMRDMIRERLKHHTDAGLGDPDDAATERHLPAAGTALADAAKALRDEARALRLALANTEG